VPVTIPIIWNKVLVRFDIAAKFSHSLHSPGLPTAIFDTMTYRSTANGG
jgi:hypothetical protein